MLRTSKRWRGMLALFGATALTSAPAVAQQKPNILFIVSDDTGYGDLGPYGGGKGRGMPTPNIAEKYVAIVPQVFDLWQDPQERYDISMNNYTEHIRDMLQKQGIGLPMPDGNRPTR